MAMPLPAGLENAGQFAFVGEFSEAEAAETEKAVVGAGTTADVAAVFQLHAGQFTRSDALYLFFFFYHHGCLSQDFSLLLKLSVLNSDG